MKKTASRVESFARCAPLVLAVLGLTAAVVVGCGIAEENDEGVTEDGVSSCHYGYGYGYGYGCYGYGYDDR